MLSVLAVRLLQLKRVAEQDPERPAAEFLPRMWLTMLQALRKRAIHTIQDFFRQLAGLGGHLGRKHDGAPGWITIWRGLKKTPTLLAGTPSYETELWVTLKPSTPAIPYRSAVKAERLRPRSNRSIKQSSYYAHR